MPVTTSKLAINDKVPWRIYSNSTRSTRPGRTGFLEEFIAFVQGLDEVWVATTGEIAELAT